jgi:hypothetical protein
MDLFAGLALAGAHAWADLPRLRRTSTVDREQARSGRGPQKVRQLVQLHAAEPSARQELVRVWSAEYCRRLDRTGLSGIPKIGIRTADSPTSRENRFCEAGGEGPAKARLGNRCSIP